MTYERGKQPNDAPVAWERFGGEFHIVSNDFDPHVLLFISAMNNPSAQLDTVCRAFHLAKLAEEAANVIANAHAMTVGAIDWLRRYRAAKGEA